MSLDQTALDSALDDPPTPLRTWGICGLMLLATMLNYMDRQALAQQATRICEELSLSNEDYGQLEAGFGLAFAFGGIVTGWVADRFSLRWLYPAILVGWSAVGFLTGSASTFRELMFCRVLLGFFEAGQWPCALAASQRLLPRESRPLGNSILQSGASLGAILTPLIVWFLAGEQSGGWRVPFYVIGAAGVVWAIAWLTFIRPRDLAHSSAVADDGDPRRPERGRDRAARGLFLRRLLVLIVVVVTINFCWQFFRAWMPKMLESHYKYSNRFTQYFSSAYYFCAAVGCLAAGYAVRWLAARGWSVHGARMLTFFLCALLTALGVAVAFLPAGWLLLAAILAIGFGSLGQFPTYYALTQELSMTSMGKVTGILSFATWIAWAFISVRIGAWIDRTGSYAEISFLAGIAPLIALAALAWVWRGSPTDDQARGERFT